MDVHKEVKLLRAILQQCKAHIRNIMPETGPICRQHSNMLDEIYAVENQINRE